ncbi:MAG: DegV family protein [Actinomycetia bacterium]|nr:DegV family protein [Actinomycetes bacterium]
MQAKIIADSTCDLSAELLERYQIRRVPLTIVKGEDELKDGDEITPQDIFAYVDSGQGVCHTAAVNVREYQAVFADAFAQGAEAVLSFTISSKLSSCYQNSVIAGEDFNNVYSIDTCSLSTGGGWLVLYAAELLQQGLSARQVVERCETKRLLSEASFVISTLDYLHKGGRCSGIAALGANLLNIKPCLELCDGEIRVGKKYRGTTKKVLRQYLRERLEGRDDLDLSRAIVTHTMYDDLQFVREMVRLVGELQPFREVLFTDAGCTVGNHCGPGTLGVLIYGKDQVR